MTNQATLAHCRDILAAYVDECGILPPVGPKRKKWLLQLVLRAYRAARSSRYPEALRVYDHLGRRIRPERSGEE